MDDGRMGHRPEPEEEKELGVFVAMSGCPPEAEQHGSCFSLRDVVWNKVAFVRVPDPSTVASALRTKILHHRKHNHKVPAHFCFLYKNAPMHLDLEPTESVTKLLYQYGKEYVVFIDKERCQPEGVLPELFPPIDRRVPLVGIPAAVILLLACRLCCRRQLVQWAM